MRSYLLPILNPSITSRLSQQSIFVLLAEKHFPQAVRSIITLDYLIILYSPSNLSKNFAGYFSMHKPHIASAFSPHCRSRRSRTDSHPPNGTHRISISIFRQSLLITTNLTLSVHSVEDIGFEPMTPCVQGRCSSQLS